MINAFKLHAATVIKNKKTNNNAINNVLKIRLEIKPLRPPSHGFNRLNHG